ncbi:50S ribosomal protein L27 [Candidatus Woesebacteria bacterium]|nr:50S ribosomal protein L27 [Candidatus Woesebacteria bacterium]
MAHKKAGGKTSQHVSPSGKRLGVKMSDGQKVAPGMILVRQRGTLVKAGDGVKVGRDHTLYSVLTGTVKFSQKLGKKFVSVVSK